jgi:hypothetical protein
MLFNTTENFWGSKTKTQIKEEISKRISTKISTKIENVNKSINKSATEITTNITNEQIKDFQTNSTSHSRAINEATKINILAKGPGTEINLKQDAKAAATMAAVIEMVENVETKNDVASKIASQLSTKLLADAESKSKLMEASKIEHLSKQQEGMANMVNNMVNNIADTVGNAINALTGSTSETNIDRKVEEVINTEIETQISNVNISENDVKNKLETVLKNSYKSMSKDECLADAEARNLMNDVNLAAFEGAKINFFQMADASTVAECLSKKNIGAHTFSGITNDATYKSAVDMANKASASSDLEKKKDEKITNITTDAFADMFGDFTNMLGNFANILPIVIGIIAAVVGVVVVVAIIFIGYKMFSGNNNNNIDIDQYNMEGGAIAIHTLQRSIILVAIMGGIDYIFKQFNKYK